MSARTFGWILSSAMVLAGAASGQASSTFQYRQGGQLWAVAFLDADRAIVAEDGGRIRYRNATSGGWKFAIVPESVQGDLRGVFVLDSQNAWVVGDNGVCLQMVVPGAFGFGSQWILKNASDPIIDGTLDGSGQPNKARVNAIHMLDSLNGWAVGFLGCMQVTTSGGEFWAEPEVALGCSKPAFLYSSGPGDDPDDAYDIHFFNSQAGIVCGDNGWVSRFTGGPPCGWTTHAAVPNETLCPVPSVPNVEYWAMGFASPTDPNSAGWMTGGEGTNQGYVLETINGGATWFQNKCLQIPPPGGGYCSIPTMYGLAMLGTTAPTAFTVGYASQVLSYETGSASLPSWLVNWNPCACTAGVSSGCSETGLVWKAKHEADPYGNPPLAGACRVSATEGCFVGNTGILRRFRPGQAPEIVDEGSLHHQRIYAGDFLNADKGCVFLQASIIKQTTDGGLTWATAYEPATLDADELGGDIAYGGASGQRVVAGGAEGRIVYSANEGNPGSWNLANYGSHFAQVNGITFAPASDTAYACSVTGKVLRSTDGGAYWTIVAGVLEGALNGISFATPTTGYVVSADGKVFYTDNSGAGWTEIAITGTPPSALFDVATWGDGSEALIVGAGGFVGQKSTGGSRFQPQTITLPAGQSVPTGDLLDIEVLGSGTTVRITGVGGRVLFRDAGAWTSPKSQSTDRLWSSSFQTAAQGFLLGQQFTVIEYTMP